MRSKSKRVLAVLWLSSVLIFSPLVSSWAEQSVGAQDGGKLQKVDAKNMFVVIDDVDFALLPTARVYSATGTPIPLSAIKPGTNVTYRLVQQKGDEYAIVELRVVPKR